MNIIIYVMRSLIYKITFIDKSFKENYFVKECEISKQRETIWETLWLNQFLSMKH